MAKLLTEENKAVIHAMARCSMKSSDVCRALGKSNTWLEKQIRVITGKTGLSPKCFYDLVALLELVRKAE